MTSQIEWFRSSDGERLTGLHAKTGEHLFWIAPSLQPGAGFDVTFYRRNGSSLTYRTISERAAVALAEFGTP